MELVINTLSVDKTKGGIRTYLIGMLSGLLAARPGWTFTLICTRGNKELFKTLHHRFPHVRLREIPASRLGTLGRILFDQLVIPCFWCPGSILLTPSNVATVLWPGRQVVVLQAPLAVSSIRRDIPHWATISAFQRHYYDWGLSLTSWRASVIVAVSDYLRRKYVEMYPTARITMVHEGADLPESSEHKNDRRGGGLLFVSTLFPYKRLDCVLQAMKLLMKSRPDLEQLLHLRVCGKDPDGGQYEEARRLARELGLGERLQLLGRLEPVALSREYANAFALVYPSEVETFGLPVIEAMAHGTPVICSNRMSVSEVAGGAGIVIDPQYPEEIASAIARLAGDVEFRQEKIQAGIERAKQFTWEKSGEGVAAVIESAA